MFCQNCGKQIPENVKFCNHCGAVQTNRSEKDIQQREKMTRQSQQYSQQREQSQQQEQQQTNLPIDENAFKKYVTPYIARNIFAVITVLTIMCLFAAPPVTPIYAGTALCFGIPWLIGRNRVNKRIAFMQENGTYENMLREFTVSKQVLGDKVRYSEKYIFGKGTGRFFDYQEIEWVYRHTVRYVIIPIRSEIMIGDNKGKIAPFCKLKLGNNSGGEEIKTLANLIHSKNPHTLFGFGTEEQKEYKRRTK